MKTHSLKTGYIALVVFLLLIGMAEIARAAITTPSSCPAILPSGVVGSAYYYAEFAGSNGTGNPWSISSGTLPTGLSLSTAGILSGTPVAGSAGTYTFTVEHKERGGQQSSCVCTLVIMDRCYFPGTDTGAILFDIDPTSAGPIKNSITTPVNFRCAAGTEYSFFYTSSQTLSGTNNSIPFTLVLALNGTSNSSITDIPLLTTNSEISKTYYQNAYAETDNNTTTVTINWVGNTGSPIYATVNAVAVVQDICSITGSPSLNFGTLDAMTNASGAVATVTPPSLMCTMGSSVTVTSNGGLNFSGTPRLRDSSMNYINYNPSFSGLLSGAGGSTDIGGSGAGRLALSALIPAGGLDNAPAGTYTDTITLTISY